MIFAVVVPKYTFKILNLVNVMDLFRIFLGLLIFVFLEFHQSDYG